MRERDFRNGAKELLTRRPWPMLPYAWQFVSRPRWLADFFGDGGLMSFPNVMLPDGPMPYADVGAGARTVHRHVERPRVDPRICGRARSSSRASIPATTRGAPSTRAPRRSSCPTTAAASSMACRRRSASCRKSLPRSAAGPKCCWTAASGAAATSSRRCASARGRCSSGARMPTVWRPPAAPASRARSRSCEADLVRTMKLLGCKSVEELDRSYVSCDRW